VNNGRREKYEYLKEFGDKPVKMNNIGDGRLLSLKDLFTDSTDKGEATIPINSMSISHM